MSNVLDDHKQQKIRALGRLGWTLSRIQEATGVRRETIGGYLKAAGIRVRGRGRPSESKPKPAVSEAVSTDSGPPKPATKAEVSTDSARGPRPGRAPSASACEPYREIIAEALERGRNAMAIWQDLVDDHGFVARYAKGRFREDLVYRLKIPPLHLPPLRERREEIPALLQHYLQKFGDEQRKGRVTLSDETLEYLLLYSWPGNIRQLANEVRRIIALAEPDATVTPALLSPEIQASRRTVPAADAPAEPEIRPRLDQPLPAAVDALERTFVRHALERSHGRVEEAARMLGISRKGLFLKRRRWGLKQRHRQRSDGGGCRRARTTARNGVRAARALMPRFSHRSTAVSGRTVSRLLQRGHRPPSQTWRTFLSNLAADLIAIDSFTVPTASATN
jgi:hypothetical protein